MLRVGGADLHLGVAETNHPSGERELQQRPAGDAEAGPESDDGKSRDTAGRVVLTGHLVGQGAADAQHAGRLLDGQQRRGWERQEHARIW